jgi:deazaflavin-dependent oxidoreductase (nitroreductase family)
MNTQSFNWKKMGKIQQIHRFLYAIGLGPLIGKVVLLLTTTGRKSGQARVTPLQYEEIDGEYYLGSARGVKSDWYRNLQVSPQVEVRVGAKRFHGTAEAVEDPARIANFLEIRLRRHPFMIGLLMEKVHGLPKHPNRKQLEELAASEAMVIIHPLRKTI